MRVVTFMAVVVLVALGPGVAEAGRVDPGLDQILTTTPQNQTVSVLVYLNDQVDLDGATAQLDKERATLRRRHETVVRSLQQVSATTQGNIVADLTALQNDGKIDTFQPFWITNAIRVDTTKDVVREIAARDDVQVVYFNYEIELIAPVGPMPGNAVNERSLNAGDITIGVIAVRAPEVWELGYTGEGVLIATLDTGVDGNHPALASRWRGVADERYADNPEWAWFDPVTNTMFPTSFGSHGTHTMGSVCGGPPGEHIGVAPGVQWIHAAVIDRVSISQTVSDAILSFQWILDPDGDPATNWDVPDVCSNSWGLRTVHGFPPCDETFWNFLDANEAAGIVMLFASGNEGFSEMRRPADRATDAYTTLAVGAIDANNPNWPIASFSSRGPTNCTPDGTAAIKPEVAAPGVNVRSSVPGGGYQQNGWSGTSMSTPHMCGVVALVRDAAPNLSVNEVKQVIFDTAVDLGATGNDNNYGWGMLDAFEAVQLALSMNAPTIIHDDGATTSPFTGYIDPRAESSNGVDLDLGVESLTLRFSETIFPVTGLQLSPDNFVVTGTGGSIPTVTAVDESDNPTIVLTLSGPIAVQEWTTVTAVDVRNASGNVIINAGNQGPGVDEPDRVDIGFLPTDVDQSGLVTPFDLLMFRQIVNDVVDPPQGSDEDFIDTDRNGDLTPFDLLVFRELLNGNGNATRSWTGETLNAPRP